MLRRFIALILVGLLVLAACGEGGTVTYTPDTLADKICTDLEAALDKPEAEQGQAALDVLNESEKLANDNDITAEAFGEAMAAKCVDTFLMAAVKAGG